MWRTRRDPPHRDIGRGYRSRLPMDSRRGPPLSRWSSSGRPLRLICSISAIFRRSVPIVSSRLVSIIGRRSSVQSSRPVWRISRGSGRPGCCFLHQAIALGHRIQEMIQLKIADHSINLVFGQRLLLDVTNIQNYASFFDPAAQFAGAAVGAVRKNAARFCAIFPPVAQSLRRVRTLPNHPYQCSDVNP